MNWCNFINGFKLNNNSIRHKQINAITSIESNTVIHNGKLNLTFYLKTTFQQLML